MIRRKSPQPFSKHPHSYARKYNKAVPFAYFFGAGVGFQSSNKKKILTGCQIHAFINAFIHSTDI